MSQVICRTYPGSVDFSNHPAQILLMHNQLMSKFVLIAAIFSSGLAFGQGFGNLATNFDGSTLLFSTPLRLKGSTQYPHPKIFKWTSGNLTLFEQRLSDVPFPP